MHRRRRLAGRLLCALGTEEYRSHLGRGLTGRGTGPPICTVPKLPCERCCDRTVNVVFWNGGALIFPVRKQITGRTYLIAFSHVGPRDRSVGCYYSSRKIPPREHLRAKRCQLEMKQLCRAPKINDNTQKCVIGVR